MPNTPETAETKLAYVRTSDGTYYKIGGGGADEVVIDAVEPGALTCDIVWGDESTVADPLTTYATVHQVPLVLGPTDPVPEGTLTGTIIVRTDGGGGGGTSGPSPFLLMGG